MIPDRFGILPCNVPIAVVGIAGMIFQMTVLYITTMIFIIRNLLALSAGKYSVEVNTDGAEMLK